MLNVLRKLFITFYTMYEDQLSHIQNLPAKQANAVSCQTNFLMNDAVLFTASLIVCVIWSNQVHLLKYN